MDTKAKLFEVSPADVREVLGGMTAEEIIAYLNLAEQTVLEILSERGMTVDELKARRRSILADENAAIDKELEGLK